MKGRNYSGSFGAGLIAAIFTVLVPSVAQAYFLFPTSAVEARVVFGGNENAANYVELISTQRVDCTYDVTTNYSGITLNWDDFGTVPVGYVNLSAYTNYQFGIGGSPTQVKIEFVDTADNRAAVFATGITPGVQAYNVPKSTLQSANPFLDISRIRFINFVVDNTAVTLTGQFTVRVDGGLPFAYAVLPNGTGTVTQLPGSPVADETGGSSNLTLVTTLSSSNVLLAYGYDPNEFGGASLLFDNFGTPTNEHVNLAAFGSVVFGLTGTPQNVKIEFHDIYTNSMSATLKSVTNSLQYYAVDMGTVSSRGVDATQIRFINFVVDSGLAGPGRETGTLALVSGGIFYSTNVPLTLAGSGSGTPTTLPGDPDVNLVGGGNLNTEVINTNNELITVTYNVSNGFTGASILYENYGTTNIESRDLSGFTSLVFGASGQPSSLKLELIDNADRKFEAYYTGITAGVKYYNLPTSLVTNDLSRITAINFVVDAALAGAGNLSGSFNILSGGLDYQILIEGPTNGTPTVLPGKPSIEMLGGSDTNTTVVTQLSTTEFSVVYGLTPSNFAGGTILFDNFGTPNTNEYQDLSGHLPLVFGVTGISANVGIEVADIFSNQMSATLLSTDSTPPPPPPGQQPEQITHYYSIQLHHLTNKGVNVSRVRFINFVVDLARAGSPTGHFAIKTGGLKSLPYNVAGATTGVLTQLPPNSTNLLSSAAKVGGANEDTTVERPSRDLIHVTYDVCTGGYAGVTLLNDDFGTTPIETANYSSYTTMVFKVRGTAASVNFEFEDATNPQTNKVTGSFTGVTTNWQYFAVSTAALQQEGLDLSHVRFINFVVNELAAGANCSGWIDVEVQGLYFEMSIGGTGTGIPTLLPNKPTATQVGGGVTGFVNTNASLMELFYILNASNFAGAIVAFDNFGSTNVEFQDLSGFTNIVFGLYGNPEKVKIEFLDTATNKMNIICTNVASTTRYFSVDTSMITNDLTKIASINFIVDANLAGTNNLFGALRVVTAGLNVTPQFGPSPTGVVTVLPPNNKGFNAFVGDAIGNSDTAISRPSRDVTLMSYNVCTGGFAAALIVHEDYGTASNEYANYGSMTELVFRVRGNTAQLGLEVKDASTNTARAKLTGVTTNWQYYAVPMSDLVAQGLVPAQVQFITLVVDTTLAGAGCNGSVEVQLGGLYYELSVSPSGAGPATTLPPLPSVTQVGEGVTLLVNTNTSLIQMGYALNPTNFAGAIILYENYGSTSVVESQDLSAITNLVFGLSGAPGSVKIEFLDAANSKMNVICTDIASTTQYFAINTTLFTNSLTNVVAINFIVDAALAGVGNETGTLNIISGGLDYRILVAGSGSGTPSALTGVKAVQEVGGGSGTTAFNHLSTSEFSVVYNVALTNYAGASIIFDDFGSTGTVESADLSSLNPLVFGITGTAANIEFQIADTSNRVVRATLAGTATATPKYYGINLAEITAKGVDVTKVIYINFVLDSSMLGGAGSGAFGVKSAGLPRPPYLIGASATGIVSTLPANSTNRLGATDETGGANVETVVSRPALNQFSMLYNVCTGGYSGATILHDDFGTAAIETANYSGSTTVVFQIRSTATKVNFEFEDATNPQTNKVSGAFTGVTTNWQYFAVSTAALQQNGLDVSHVRFINFVIDSNSGGPCSGTLDVQIQGLYFEPTISGSTNGPATVLPGNPAITNVAGGNGGTIVINTNFSLIEVTYAVSTGFSGGSILWENFGTTNIESQNLSIFTNIVFGLYGKPAGAKIEVQDSSGRVMRINCTGVTTNLQYYRIDSALFTNDLGHVTAINFVLDAGIAGTGNTTGKLNIVSGGFIHPFFVSAGGGPESVLPPGPPDVTARTNSNSGTVVTTAATNHFFVDYNVASGSAGAMIRYNDPATGPIESGDFSSFGSIVFQIKGNPNHMRFEFVDTNGVKVTGSFLFLDTTYQYYAVPTAELVSRAFDIAHVTEISFYEDLQAAGLDDATGRFDVIVGGISYTPAGPTDFMPRADDDGDGLPNDWEQIYGLGTGNGSGDNGPGGDPDGDGVSNRDEYYAGSNPTDGNSFSAINFSRTGTTFYISMDGFSQRRYQLECLTSLVSGTWSAIGSPTQLVENGGLARTQTVSTNGQVFYRYSIKPIGVTPLVGTAGKPDIRVVFGGNEGAGTVITTNSPTELVMQYNISTGGYSGITFNFDPGFSNQSMDMSDYPLVTFALSGTPSRVKYEFEDTSGIKVSGNLIGVTNSYKSYSIRTSMLASNGLDIAHVRFINFVVDGALAGPGNEIGTLGVRTYGLTYSIQPPSQGSGSATALPSPPAARVDNLGGANSAGTWTQNGTTNVVMNYTVASGGYDGFIFRYEDFVEPGAQSGDFVATPTITFGISGSPQSVKVEFIDDTGFRVNTYVNGITGTTGWYTFSTADLEDSGLDIRHIQFINFVVDQALAGGGNFSGSINVVTSGLAP